MLCLVFIRMLLFYSSSFPRGFALEDRDPMGIQGHAILDFLVDFK